MSSDLRAAEEPGATTPASTPPGQARRLDIEGLRAVAILLVVIYHGGVSWLHGGFVGVDVFFVISGFLITGLLVREIERTGRVSLSRFYARRAKRLLPATALVLVATAVLTVVTTTQVQWRTFGWDMVSAALYVVNWRLADRSVDYLAEDVGASPVQHFWSLAVEEQFYIVWPLLLVALAWWLRRHPARHTRTVLSLGLLAVVLPSLAYSAWLTVHDPGLAFFVTPTRLWELGIGGLVAIAGPVWSRLPRGVAAGVGWVGLVVVLASGLVMDSSTAWPGVAAAVPVLGTAAVVVAGFAAGPGGPVRVLSWRPAVWVGSVSYSWYLWHWPLLTAAKAAWGDISTWTGLLVVVAALVPAYLSLRLVEDPARHSRTLSRSTPMTLSVGANATAVGAVAGLALVLAVPSAPSVVDAPGATALASSQARPGSLESLSSVTTFTPDAAAAPDDVPAGYADGCQDSQTATSPTACEWGDPEGTRTVVLVGDSKALQYQTPIDEIARARGWKVVSYTKSACGFHAGTERARDVPYTECTTWNDAVVDEIERLRPDAVITSQGSGMALQDPADTSTDSTQAMVDALVTRWQDLVDEDVRVVSLVDNPHPPSPVYECVAEHTDDLSACAFDRAEGERESAAPAQEAAAKKVPKARLVDMRPQICPEDQCVPVIGGVLVYRQTSHVTDTYMKTLTPTLRDELVPAVED
ncbi:acyltransferase family protein [Janibacter melonis]|uniref:acyltransferase family protein n=1 Tax=Janibacter melonis TaxID=262209 RepID=UPI00177A8762|nr:acyltransferase [Janibacter melonis]